MFSHLQFSLEHFIDNKFIGKDSEPHGLGKMLQLHAGVDRRVLPWIFLLFFPQHTTNKIEIISVEATISEARAPSKTIALKSLQQSNILAALIRNKRD